MNSIPSDKSPEVRDHVVAVLKVAVGAVPLIGPALSEIVGLVIPDLHRQRFEAFISHVGERLQAIDAELLMAKLRKPENVDVLEEGVRLSLRSMSQERIEWLGRVVSDGIGDDEVPYVESKRLLRLLGELDDGEVIILASRLWRNLHDKAYWERHQEILLVPDDHSMSTPDERDRYATYRLAVVQLERLGLAFSTDQGLSECTSAGRLLLRRIGLADAEDV